jgi:predicted ribosome quality control (RQC) complex YloA/Tae2 family protein
MRLQTINDTKYMIGTNAKDNWDIIKQSNCDWLWFHLEKFASSHIVICKPSNDITRTEINTACQLCVDNSKYKFKNIGLVYCQVNNLRLGEEVGSVNFISNRKVNKIKC